MRNAPLLLLAAALALAGSALGQPASFSVPGLGYIVDSSKGVRPLIGVADATFVADPLQLGFPYSDVAVSPRHDYLFATDEDARLVLLRLPVTSPTEFIAAAPDSIRFSPSGHSAALYYRKANQLKIVSGLPEAANVDAYPLGAISGLSAFAVSDDGRHALLASEGGCYSLSSTGFNFVSPIGPVSSIEYMNDRNSAVLAGRERNSIYTWDGRLITPFASEAEGVSQPVAIAISADGRRLLVLNRGGDELLLMSFAGDPPVAIVLENTVASLERLRGMFLVRLNAAPGRSLLFDGSGGSRLLFLPNPDSSPAGAK